QAQVEGRKGSAKQQPKATQPNVQLKKGDGQEIKVGTYCLDCKNHRLTRKEKIQRLTEKEVALIHYLAQRKNQLIKRENILQEIWGNDDYFSGRSMDVFISRLRKYFKSDTKISIESRRGIGFVFHIDN